MMTPIDFRGFRFGNVHSSDLHLEVVSTSNRYEARILPAPTDTVQDVPGSDGQYYFGSVYKNREITINVAFDNVTEQIYRKIRQLFATDKPQDLVFDEEPYKTWKAKLKAKPDFKSLCFTDDDGNRVYKGDGKLQFICYFPYAFCFDKYVVKAADYYMLTPPEQILCEISNDEDDFYFASRNLPVPAWIPADLRYHYNVHPKDPYDNDPEHYHEKYRQWDPNDGLTWKTGYPTIEQVQNGELYFDLNGVTKTLVTTRGYWDNIPLWQSTAKLLITPTLDYEQELMYLPQYSKDDYINMELGFNKTRPMIGSRILVYNPGDLPIDWELQINVNKKGFWSNRGGRFRIRRFNVERLSIPQAVDWCNLTTFDQNDNELYKYGDKYFKRKIDYYDQDEMFYLQEVEPEGIWDEVRFFADKNWEDNNEEIDYNNITYNLHLDDKEEIEGEMRTIYKDCLDMVFQYQELKEAHPKYCYYVEPIPRQLLGHYIKLFYWQSNELLKHLINTADSNEAVALLKQLNFEEGIKFANRYEELLKQCINVEEEYELYWTTLRKLLSLYYSNSTFNEQFYECNGRDCLFNQFVNNPLEFISVQDLESSYDEDNFNICSLPQWITKDYLEIDTSLLSGVALIKEYMNAIGEDELSIFTGHIVRYDPNKLINNQKLRRKLDKLLDINQPINDLLNDCYYLNSETRMLYSTENPHDDLYHYKPIKNVMNEAITKGTWFKLPSGWSIIMIEPVVDEAIWNRKTWMDARPFDWGYGGDLIGHEKAVSQLYNYIYNSSKEYFFDNIYTNFSPENMKWPEENYNLENELDSDEKINFKLWYENIQSTGILSTAFKQYWFKQKIIAEYTLLKLINERWQIIAPHYAWTSKDDCEIGKEIDVNGKTKGVINGEISDWWWYACNYIWANFPPLYWAAADCFNNIKIKYTPLFY